VSTLQSTQCVCFAILGFLVILLFKVKSKYSAKVQSTIPKSKKVVMYLTKKMTLDKLY
jgi:hypothetical protein